MNCYLVESERDADGNYVQVQGNALIGQSVSSLHRLKDVNNKGEYFP